MGNRRIGTGGLLFVLLLAGASSIQAYTVTFDGLATNESWNGPYGVQKYGVIPEYYEGLRWTPVGEYGWNVGDGPSYKTAYRNSYNPPSGDNFAYNSGLAVTYIEGLFNFEGAYFSTWAQNNAPVSFSSTTVNVRGYSGSTLVGQETWTLSSTAFVWHAANIRGIDRLELRNDTGGANRYWTMDSFEYTTPGGHGSPPICEPAALGLLGLGAVGLTRRRRT